MVRGRVPGRRPSGIEGRDRAAAGGSMRGSSADDPVIRAVMGWDVRNWSRALPLWQRHIDANPPHTALAIGEHDGGLSLWLARQGFEVICSDLEEPLDAARALHARYGVGASVTYESVDVTSIAHPDESLDLVIFKSVIGALRSKPRQVQAITEIHRVLRPGGLLLFAENLSGSWLHRQLRSRFVAWHDWRYIDLARDLDLFDGFDEIELETWGLFGALGRSERQRDFLGRIDAAVVPHVPAAWRYIVFGACRKGAR
jgi:SAM-dependent methyltransferase